MTDFIIAPCRQCLNPEAQFYPRRQKGVIYKQSVCLRCAGENKKKWYQENREYFLLKERKRYARNRATILARKKARQQANKEATP